VSSHSAPPAAALLDGASPRAEATHDDIVDFVMLEPQQDFARVFAPAAAALVAGWVMVLLSPAHVTWLPVLGAVLLASAPVGALLSFVRASRGEAYVAIRKVGLSVRLEPNTPERVLAWEQIEDVSCREKEGAVALTLPDCVVLLRGPFEDLSVGELTLRIRNARRLAVWNRLTRSALKPWC
jgi:hypothetical protein